jgi:hypothetical protein
VGEGCTPGFWRVPQHFDSWTGYATNQPFSSVFGRVITVRTKGSQSNNTPYLATDPTLLEAVWAQGGGINDLARHAVAALLNASSPDVDYMYSVASVIAMFQAAYDSGNYGPTATMFMMENELGCPIDSMVPAMTQRVTRDRFIKRGNPRAVRGSEAILSPN